MCIANKYGLPAIATVIACLLFQGCGRINRRDISNSPSSSVTYAESLAAMEADGTLGRFITTRKKAGKQALPKHPGKAWQWFVEPRLEIGSKETKLPSFYRQEAFEETKLKNMNKSSLTKANAQWQYIGPGGLETNGTPVQPSGRLVEIAVNPDNTNIVYAAAASGGLFKTTDQGVNWTNVTDNSIPSLGLGSVKISPFNSSTVLIGLGEGVPGSHYEPTGAGIYRSTDSGGSWTMIPGTASFEHVVDIDFLGSSDAIIVAAKGRNDGRGAGLFVTNNGGANWTTVSGEPYYDVLVDPGNRQHVLATRALYRTQQGSVLPIISRSTNGGANFAAATTPAMLSPDQQVGVDRIELSRSGSSIYALVAGTDSGVFGIWRSTDGGANWTARAMGGIPTTGDFKPGQMTYNCAIVADPSNPDVLFVGSNLRMYRSADGGATFAARSDWAGDESLPYVHADHHHAWISPNGQTIYFGTDGGFFVSTNGGTTWTERNNGLTATQLYRIANHPTNRNAVIMGAQDNDKYLRRSDGTWHHYPNTFGDGMEMISWPGNADVFMGTNYFGGNTRVTLDAGTNWYYMRTYEGQNNGIPDAEKGAWVSPFLLDPQNTNKMYLALQHLYVADFSTTNIPAWTRLITFNNGAPQTMELLEFTAGPSNRKLVGFHARQTESSFTVGMWRANVNGTNVENFSLPRVAWVSALATDPNANDTIWIGFSDISTDRDPKPRLYKSTTLGNTWTDMTNNFPTNLPVGAIWIDPTNSSTIIVGSDIGVYRSDNGGAEWVFWNEGLPKVVVSDFEYFAPERLLRAGTYGRGMWETPIDSTTGNAPSIRIQPNHLSFP